LSLSKDWLHLVFKFTLKHRVTYLFLASNRRWISVYVALDLERCLLRDPSAILRQPHCLDHVYMGFNLWRRKIKRHLFIQLEDFHMCCSSKQAQDWPRDAQVCGPKQAQDWPRDPQVCGTKQIQDWLRDPQVSGPKQAQDWPRDPHVLWSETGRGVFKKFLAILQCRVNKRGSVPRSEQIVSFRLHFGLPRNLCGFSSLLAKYFTCINP